MSETLTVPPADPREAAVSDPDASAGHPCAADPVAFLIAEARTNFAAFVAAVHRPRFRHSAFSARVCRAIDQFVEDLLAGKRPVLMLTAPPQTGKSSLISRCLPPYLFGRLRAAGWPEVRIANATYALPLARRNATDMKSIMFEPIFREIFPECSMLGFRGAQNTQNEFDVPGGKLRAVGVGGPMTGFSLEVALLDDLTKDAQEALSPVVQDGIEAWYESVLLTRLQLKSGVIIMGTPWSANDILARVKRKLRDNPKFTLLSFPALNYPDEIGYNPELPHGALVPALHSEEKLREMRKVISDFWWASMFQQTPLAEFGAIFPRSHLQYYRRADLPKHFIDVIMSVDAAFKDGDASDYVAIGVWGKTSDNRVWLLGKRREKLGFMATAQAITDLKSRFPYIRRIFIEDAANGPALRDMLRKHFPQIEGVPPLGSKEARAHAVSWVWSNDCVMLPHPEEDPGIVPWVDEITSFPDTVTGHDDVCDCMALALQQLCLRSPIASLITQEILRQA